MSASAFLLFLIRKAVCSTLGVWLELIWFGLGGALCVLVSSCLLGQSAFRGRWSLEQ